MVEFMCDLNFGIYLYGDVYYNGISVITNIETLNFFEDITYINVCNISIMLENVDSFSWYNEYNSNFYFLNDFYSNMFGKFSSFINKKGQLNLLLYEYILYEQPYINLNMIDLINPKKHLDVS